MDAIEHLKSHAWKTPRDYGGFSPVGDYVLATRTRDSDALDRSNWECIGKEFGTVDWDCPRDAYSWNDAPAGKAWNARPVCYVWRAGHWACGWIEYMMVRADAPDDILTSAGETLCALADYPIYSEDHFSELEFTEACELWERSSVADRVDLCRDAGVSIFAARRDDMPSDDCGYIQEYLRG